MMLTTGTVKFFDSRDNKRFGFIRKENGQEVFFHLNDFGPLSLDNATGDIEFGRNGAASRMPSKGDVLVFSEAPGRKGPKASPWAFVDQYEPLKKRSDRIVSANSVVYRVMHQYSYPGGGKDDPLVKFEGTLKELNKKHPKPEDYRYDDLFPTFGCSDFDETRWFERKEGDEWVNCDDPRTPLSDWDYRRAKRGW